MHSMVDIHSHILPGIDDGARSMEESIEMARQAVAGGTTVMFTTSHTDTGTSTDSYTKITSLSIELQGILDELAIPLRLFPGYEVYPAPGIVDAIDKGVSITLGNNGKYMLLDTPLNALPPRYEHLLFDIQARGITPIIAHPERCMVIQQDPSILEPMLQRGVLVQINASSLVRDKKEPAYQTAVTLLDHRWVHFIASDSHSPRRRQTRLAQASEKLGEMVGEEMLIDLVSDNGRRIIGGNPVHSSPMAYMAVSRKRTIFDFLRIGSLFNAKLAENRGAR